MNTLHIFREDLSAEQTWDLLAWCAVHGANEFTVTPIGVGMAASTLLPRLDSFCQGKAKRSRFGSKASPIPIWELNDKSIALLKSILDEGLFTYSVGEDEWFEDPILFRNGEFFLGIVTHESEGIIRATPEEQTELDAKGIGYRNEGQWVGYIEGTTTA